MYSSIAHANEAIVARIKEARPFWTGVHLAKEVIPALREGKPCCMQALQLNGRT